VTTYTAIFESAPDGAVWGWIPEIPGATGTGDTIEEAEANLKIGLEVWIETERELGHAVPAPTILATRTVTTDAA
jgi:predicted RNase H-like HicB family nuclease